MTKITFNCDFCKTVERSEPLSWYKKKENHFCSRLCANRFNANKKATGLTRKEYEKQYWSKPENKERKKIAARDNHRFRQEKMGKSFIKNMLNRCKTRAITKGLDFNLEIEDIVVPEFCPILGIKLEVNKNRGGKANSPSLDRINNELGYVKGNVQVISKRANLIKSDATLKELQLLCDWLSALKFG